LAGRRKKNLTEERAARAAMARKRMIDPNIWDSPSFANLSVLAKLIFIGMISNADDEGRGRANANYLKSKIFPYDCDMRSEDIESALDEIAKNASVLFYLHRGCEYYSFERWKRWQRVDKPQPSLITAYDAGCCSILRSKADAGFEADIPALKRTDKAENAQVVCESVIARLNEKACTAYRPSAPATLALIDARLGENYGIDDFIRVIDKKAEEWMGTPMQKYLRPQTLFGDKFEGYLNQEDPKPQKRTDYSHEYDLRAVEELLFGA